MNVTSGARRATALAADPAALARLFRVLGDPTRLRIVNLLADGERTVTEIVAAVGGLQPRVSTHLACLRHCRIVEAERRGREVTYRLAVDGLDALLEQAAVVAAPRSEHLASCERTGPEWM